MGDNAWATESLLSGGKRSKLEMGFATSLGIAGLNVFSINGSELLVNNNGVVSLGFTKLGSSVGGLIFDRMLPGLSDIVRFDKKLKNKMNRIWQNNNKAKSDS
jgi:hypothetical protein